MQQHDDPRYQVTPDDFEIDHNDKPEEDKLRVYFDLETSGLSEWRHEIIQAAFFCPQTQDQLELKIQFDEDKADPKALELNHYDPDVWAREAVMPHAAVERISDYMRRHACVEKISKRSGKPYKVAKLCAYNGKTFDGPFLQQWYRKQDAFLAADYKVLDTLALAEFILPELESHKLEEIAKHLGCFREGAHDAMIDVYMLCDVTQILETRIKHEEPQ